MLEKSTQSGVPAAERSSTGDGLLAIAGELAEKYSISEQAALDLATETISATLSARAGCQATVTVEDGLALARFHRDGPFPEVMETGLGGLPRNIVKTLRIALEKAFAQRAARDALVVFRPIVGRAVLGDVVKALDDGGVLVEIENGGYSDGRVTAFCGRADVPLRERGKLAPPQKQWFYVKSARVADHQGLARIEIFLSRTSARLPELLLARALMVHGKCVTLPLLKCVRRIPGALSEIESSMPLDKGTLAAVGMALGGEIIRVVD